MRKQLFWLVAMLSACALLMSHSRPATTSHAGLFWRDPDGRIVCFEPAGDDVELKNYEGPQGPHCASPLVWTRERYAALLRSVEELAPKARAEGKGTGYQLLVTGKDEYGLEFGVPRGPAQRQLVRVFEDLAGEVYSHAAQEFGTP